MNTISWNQGKCNPLEGGSTVLNLRTIRKERGWSLTQLTVKTGIDGSSLSKIERGIWPCGPGWRKRLAEAFELPEEELFRRVGESDDRPVTFHRP
jgi:transcriptional regulator with XRE-family HTH domain